VLSLTQKQADTKCNFPVNTIRDIEGKHCVPTEKQQNILQKVLGVQLKVITLK
jgi:ribosome-binding protein aMBF1 (putative translation factor)